jgi:hypothetical protein
MPVVRQIVLPKKIHAEVSDPPGPITARDRLNHQIQHTKIECVPIGDLKPNRRNAKKHPDRQIALLVENYKQFGFTQPILIDEDGVILCGHGRYFAANRLELAHLPAIRLSGLSPAEKQALAIADNKLPELGEWDLDLLQGELAALFDIETELSFDPFITGYETAELDQILQNDPDTGRADPADQTQPLDPAALPITANGDVWECGAHKVLCGSSLEPSDVRKLMGDERAGIAFADGPYNVPNGGHVTRRADVREFAMANGEMSEDDFTAFNRIFCQNLLTYLVPGAVVYLCMDWRHLRELMTGAGAVFGALRNLIVWVKTNAGWALSTGPNMR